MENRYTFYPLRNMEFSGVDKQISQDLLKWAMKDGMKLQAFSYDHPYKAYLIETFVQDFFSSQEVTQSLHKLNLDHQFVPIGRPATSVKMRSLKCSLTTMNIFDRLSEDEQIVRRSGRIKKCPDDFHSPWIEESQTFGDYVEVGNELRKMFVNTDESDFSNLYSADEKDEFLFRIFGHLVIGGSLCQYDDTLSPYLTAAKVLYKDLVSIQFESGTELPKVSSHVIQVVGTRSEQDGSIPLSHDLLFSKSHLNNFFYMVIDPIQRIVKTLCHHV